MRVNNYNMRRTSDYILTLLTDASKARVLTLVGKNLEGMVVTADTNADKAKLFKGKFFPIVLSRVQVNKTEQEDDYPEPEFDFEPISNTRIQNVISKLEPYKAPDTDKFSNSVLIYYTDDCTKNRTAI
jgi:hypothetical protein